MWVLLFHGYLTTSCLGGYTSDELTDLLIYGNTVASLSIQKHGAIAAMPSLEEISAFQAERLN